MTTTILTHSDADGICAGAVALCRFPKSDVFFTKPVSFYYDLKHTDAERIIICDIALTKQDAKKTLNLMRNKGSEILYFDHHIIPETVRSDDIEAIAKYIHKEGISASELIYSHYQKELPRERIWIAIYGAIADYCDETPFIIKKLKSWDRRTMYFEVSTLVMGIKNDEFNTYDAKRKIVSVMAKGGNPSDVPGLVMSAKEAVSREFDLYDEVKTVSKTSGDVAFVKDIHSFGFRGPAALFAATVQNRKVGLSIYTRRKYLDITIRSRESIPLNILAERSAEAVSGSGGGHPAASGAKIPLGSLDRFLKEMNGALKKL
jgi:RecJ-like exonuclease